MNLPPIQRIVYRFSEVGSPMDEARSLVAAACPPGAIVLADRQLSGRGRIAGRVWKTNPGDSILMTLILGERSAGIAALPLRAGLGACMFAEERLRIRRAVPGTAGRPGPVFRIKWPNDLLYAKDEAAASAGQWRKMCGILCESSGGRALVGVGFNLSQTPETFPPEVAGKAGSLGMALESAPGDLIPSDGGVEALALELASSIEAACGRADWREQVSLRLLGLGKEVLLMEGHPDSAEPRRGMFEDIDDTGRILLRGSDGALAAYASAEFTGFTVAAGTSPPSA